MSFQDIWCKIEKHAGETFHTKDGKEFTYEIQGELFVADQGEQLISKNDFQNALKKISDVTPEELERIVKGPAYVWSVLSDERIAAK